MPKSFPRTISVLCTIIFSASCGNRLNTPFCPQKDVDDNKSPIPQVTYASDTEIVANKVSSGRSANERDTGSAELAEETTADDASDTYDTKDTASAESSDSVNLPNNTARAFHLSKGRILLIDNKQASIIDKNDRILCKNKTLIRLKDEYFNCASDGFVSVKKKKGGFVLEQQSCSNKYIISETIEFRFSRKGDEIYLYKFGLEYMNKFTDEHESIFFHINAEAFGRIMFENVDLEQLYELAWTKAEKTTADDISDKYDNRDTASAESNEGSTRHNDAKQPGVDLYWIRCSVGKTWNGSSCIGKEKKLNWQEANRSCPNGYRLPTQKELVGLLGGCDGADKDWKYCHPCEKSKYCGRMFPADKSSYWSSSPFESGHWLIWIAAFGKGFMFLEEDHKKNSVRCVRSGP